MLIQTKKRLRRIDFWNHEGDQRVQIDERNQRDQKSKIKYQPPPPLFPALLLDDEEVDLPGWQKPQVLAHLQIFRWTLFESGNAK